MRITFDEIESLAQSPLSFPALCERYPDDKPLRFYQERDGLSEVSPRALRRRVAALGAELAGVCEPGQRAVLLLPRVEDYVIGLLACFHANVVAVPTVVDAANRSAASAEMIASVAADSEAVCLLADPGTARWIEDKDAAAGRRLLTVPAGEPAGDGEDGGEETLAPPRAADPDDLAMMMYTSGSTSLPKGVMVTHRALLYQAALAAALWEIDDESTVVSWLALTHNFGLPLGLLVPLLTGAATVLLAPGLFVSDPGYWLELLSRYRATHTGAPNSTLEYCVNSVSVDELRDVSLDSVISVFCAGEPLREQTVTTFTETLAPLGLRPDAVRPHYGTTEVGCLATESSGSQLTVFRADVEALARNKAVRVTDDRKYRPLVRNGKVRGPLSLRIVHPETREECAPGDVGEIWFKFAGNGRGYHGKPQESAESFDAALATTGEGGYFRTGDLGFLDDGYLYLVGRVKELLIVNGMKYYPPDLETTVRKRVPELRLTTAVFATEGETAERIVLVQELPERLSEDEYQRLVRRVRAVVSDYYGIALHDIVFTEPDAIPRSGIGKVRRNSCRERYESGELPVWFSARGGAGTAPGTGQAPAAGTEEVRHRLVHDVVAPALDVTPDDVRAVDALGELGCTSMQYIQLAKKIEEVFGLPFTPAKLFRHNRLGELAAHLAEHTGATAAGDGTPPAPAPAPQPAAVPAAAPEPAAAAPAPQPGGNDGDDGDAGAIAVIGIACRFPGGANDPDAFWRNLDTGTDCITPIRDSRPQLLTDQARQHGDLTDFPESAGFADGVDEFDAAFFGISPLEAQAMDPQQRKLMELTWHVIEDGGYRPSALRGRRVGVYVGAHSADYAELLFSQPALAETYGAYMDSGTHPALLANRVSRWYDLHGPSRVFNTACSSSLIALDAAVRDLRAGACTEAVVGGVNTLLSARSFHVNYKSGMQASDGRCKTFDARADGYVRAEGYGAVLLKPLAAAERDGDRVYAVIRGTAANHDGQTDSLRAPNPAAQKELITAAFADAGIAPGTVGYIEAHGTGTALGDPIEVQGLVDAFRELDPALPAGSCGLGSVKTHIGHLESAAGIAGFIKLLLCLRHQRLPGLLHFQKLNPFIELDGTPFRVVAEAEPWQRKRDASGAELPLRAGVSSFGFGGANAHVIVEEYRGAARPAPAEAPGPLPIVLSARDEDRLRAQAGNLLRYLADHPATDVAALSRTLRTAREEMAERLAFEAESAEEAASRLRAYLAGERAEAGIFTGNTKQSRDFAAFFGEDDDLRDFLGVWLRARNYAKVLDLWVRGVPVDWSPLEEGAASALPAPPGLPGYPFARDRHWFTDTFGDDRPAAGGPRSGGQLHPLVHENVSDFAEERFRSHYSGQEYFLRDHVEQGRPSLPAAAWLEAARAAVSLAHGRGTAHTGIVLSDLSWDETYVREPGTAGPVDISLMLDSAGAVDFDCYQPQGGAGDGQNGGQNGEQSDDPSDDLSENVRLFCQGRATLAEDTPDSTVPVVSGSAEPHWSAADAEAALARAGVRNGPAYQALTEVRKAPDHCVALLRLPRELCPTAGDFVAHPVLLTAALQVAALWPGRLSAEAGTVPSALESIDEVRFLGRCTDEARAVITESTAAREPGDAAPPLDIVLSDAEGRPLIRLTGVRFGPRAAAA